MRLAAIDIGTNAVLLSVAETCGDRLRPLLERATITRLGEGVDASRRLTASAVERTLSALGEYADILKRSNVDRVVAVGTSALRDAEGGDEFRRRAERVMGVPLDVISGAIEARLTFEGGLSGLDVAGDVLLFDVGGGSTEIVVGIAGGAPLEAISLDVGSVRLFERHVAHDPPDVVELSAVRTTIERALERRPAAPPGARGVGVAGTVTTLASLAAGSAVYDSSAVHGTSLSAAQLRHWRAALSALPVSERRRLPGMEPGRADVLPIGALLVEAIVDAYGLSDIIVSDRGVRWGALERLARGTPVLGA